MSGQPTTWDILAEAVAGLPEPFTRAQILAWTRRHYPDAHEVTVRSHVQFATDGASSRGGFVNRTPLLTRVGHGQYIRYRGDAVAESSTPPADPAVVGLAAAPATGEAVSSADQGEATIQAAIVKHLAVEGWQIRSVADTASPVHGYDIVAARSGRSLRVEVKGYPGATYTAMGRAGEPRTTSPATQARMYFSNALLKLLMTIQEHPDDMAAVGLPDETTYRNLVTRTATPLGALGAVIYWVSRDGRVHEQRLDAR